MNYKARLPWLGRVTLIMMGLAKLRVQLMSRVRVGVRVRVMIRVRVRVCTACACYAERGKRQVKLTCTGSVCN